MAAKTIVTYKSLLNLCTLAGLLKIKTEIVQLPTEENGHVAVSRATITMADGREFDGTADAAPNNVSSAMQTCLPRMAETRAKARAMRDCVNIGEVSVEELSDYDDAQPARGARSWGGNVVNDAQPQPVRREKPAPEGPITEAQITAITNLCKGARIDTPEGFLDWTNAKACEYISSATKKR